MKRKVVAIVALALASSTLLAQEVSGRLARIKENATLVVSYSETGLPFSYVGPNGPLGFGPDISRKVADAVQQHLGLPALKIRWNAVTLSSRFPMIVTNTVDLECVTTTNTRRRQEMVGFSTTFYVADEGIAVRRDSGIRGYADLAGKRVATVRGTPIEAALNAKGLTVVAESNNRGAMAALVQGRADAYVASSSIIAGELLRLDDASALQVVPGSGNQEAFACMLPKGDVAFKQVVDAALTRIMKSGDMEAIYNKWFMSPIPPFNRNVNMPLNAASRQLYLEPNDTALE